MSDGENNESPQKEETPIEQSGEEDAQGEENKADVSTESAEDVTDNPDNEVEPVESEDTTVSDSPAKKSPVKRTPKKKREYEYVDDDKERLGLLERPVIIESGKREKRKVERLEMTGIITAGSQKTIEVPEGSGEKLGDCPRIEYQLQKNKKEELKVLHRILYGRLTSPGLIRKNIRMFYGFPFSKEDKEYDKKTAVLSKINMSALKHICEILDLERSGRKEEIMARLMNFLLHPKSSGKDLPQKKRKSLKGDKKQGVKRKRGSSGKKAKSAKKEKSVDDSAEDSDESPVDEEESEPDEKGDAPEKDQEELSEEEEEEEEEEESEDEAPKKKKQKLQKTPKKVVKEPKKAKPEKKKKEKVEKKTKEKSEKKPKEKQEKKKAASPKKPKVSKEKDDDSSEDDEPLVKKQSNEPPSDEDLKESVKKILEGANLEEVTMKTVLKQVYEMYPAFDLSDRKTYIKNTVKQLIS